jgi:hypothetical protein
VEASGSNPSASEPFEVSSSPETAAEESVFEGANVCRVAALSTMFGGHAQAVRDLEPELEALGFSARLSSGERIWEGVDRLRAFSGLRVNQELREGQVRVFRWQMIQETSQPEAAVAFLVAVLGSAFERESAAAAAALWRLILPFDSESLPGGRRLWRFWDLYDLWERGWLDPAWWDFPWLRSDAMDMGAYADDLQEMSWDGDQWVEIYRRVASRLGDQYSDIFLVGLLARLRLGRALRSPDAVTRSLAMAAFPPTDRTSRFDRLQASGVSVAPPEARLVSTMIHGTWGWKGDWWRPRSDFHEFILRNHRPGLYRRGTKFSWSGAPRDAHRQLAAADFCEWASDVAPKGLQTVFAHSYGGDVAARAALQGIPLTELVLLSVPVTGRVEAAVESDLRVVDVRLRFDPILGLARTRQRIPARPNVTTVLLEKWRLDHGASHKTQVWLEETVARRGGI